MNKLLVACAALVLFVVMGAKVCAQAVGASPAVQSNTSGAQARIVGEVTAVDAAGRRVSVKTADGQVVTVIIDDKTALLRLPPGATQQEKAVRITLADVSVSDRLFARGGNSNVAGTLVANQFVVTGAPASSSPASPQQQAGREGEDRARRVLGRVSEVNARAKELTVLARSRDGAEPIVVNASGNVRFLRFASDSLNVNDAVPGSFADIRAGDQLRVRGERSADGKIFRADEIVSGTIVRAVGTVTSVSASGDEVTIRGEQEGPLTVVIGKRSALRRITPEVAETFAQRRAEGRERRRNRNTAAGEDGERRGRRERNADDATRAGTGERSRRQGPGGGGRNLQEVLASLPPIAPAELKKGDVVLVTGTAGTDATRVNAVTLITGDAEFLGNLQRMQGRRGDRQDMSPGLPGDVLGGGTGGSRDQP